MPLYDHSVKSCHNGHTVIKAVSICAESTYASLVVIRSPTVTDQMAHYVAPVAFGRTWTIMMIVAFRTQWLGLAHSLLPCILVVQLSLSDSTFSDGGDDEDIRTARDLVSKDKMIWCGEVGDVEAGLIQSQMLCILSEGKDHRRLQQKGRPELGAPPPPRPPHPSQHHHHRCHHQMTRYHNCLIRRQDGQQDPPQGPPYPLPDRS
ncbi:hypothetical protein Tco_0892309 [Tanacetum coccineum]|uniref:Uncharacterized protein n=1 Tax=Tanacetum coccineum TaxID=301880 RepID=A0ABQ5C7E5_9ASTR